MKKFFLWLLLLCSLGISLYFGVYLAAETYFNESFYYAPNLVGLNIDTAKSATSNAPIQIMVDSQEFSKAPINQIFRQDPDPGQVIKKDRIIRVWVSKGNNDKVVPDLSGINILDAKSIIESKGFKVGSISNVSLNFSEGEVISSNPSPNDLAMRGDKINLLVNSGSRVSTVEMPDLIGLPINEARDVLKESNLFLGTVSYEIYQDVDPGTIVKASVDYKASVKSGSTINVTVSK